MTADTPSSDTGWRDLMRAGRLPQLALLCLGVWLNAADTLVTATIMPSIVRDIGGYAYFAWPVAVYLLGAIVAGASAGRLSETVGLRAALIGAAGLFALGCVFDAAAPTIWVFLIGRLVQGLGAGWIGGLVYVAVNTVFPRALWTRVLATISGVWGVATLLGPGFGGLFAELGLWRVTYWAFAGQALLFALAALLLVPRRAAAEGGGGFPGARLVLLAIAILTIADAGARPSLMQSAAMLAAGAALLAGFVVLDARAPRSLLPRQLTDTSGPSGAGYRMTFLATAAAVGFPIYAAALLQTLYGLSPLEAGYVVGAEAMAWTLSALSVAHLAERWHGVFIRSGTASICLGLVGLGLVFPGGSLVLVIAASILLGSGFGQCWAFTTHRIFAGLPEAERARGSSAVPAVQLTGNAVGAAIAGTLANLLGMTGGLTAADAANIGRWLYLAMALLAFGAVLSGLKLARFEPDGEGAPGRM